MPIVETPQGPQMVHVPVTEKKCKAVNKAAPWLQVQTLDSLRASRPRTLEDFAYVSCCRCRSVQLGFDAPPVYCVLCCCNDCVTAAHYIDKKAAASYHHNISFLELGNPKAARVAAFAPSAMTIIKGKEHIAQFKMRPSSRAIRTYARCCSTIMIGVAGSGYSHHGLTVPINLGTIEVAPGQPPVQQECRVHVSECVGGGMELPHGDRLPNYEHGSWNVLQTLARCRLLGTGGVGGAADPLLSATSERVQEIAGRAAYESCGFYSVAGLDDPAGGMLGLPSLASLGASLGMESLGFGNPTGTEGQWRCDWCGCSPEATPSRRRGPEGPATLCHACGETFARGERLMLGHHNEASRRGGVAPETAASWHGGWLSVGIPWSAPN